MNSYVFLHTTVHFKLLITLKKLKVKTVILLEAYFPTKFQECFNASWTALFRSIFKCLPLKVDFNEDLILSLSVLLLTILMCSENSFSKTLLLCNITENWNMFPYKVITLFKIYFNIFAIDIWEGPKQASVILTLEVIIGFY